MRPTSSPPGSRAGSARRSAGARGALPELPDGGAENGALVEQEVPLRNAMNEVLRDEYSRTASARSTAGTRRCQRGGVKACRSGCQSALPSRAWAPAPPRSSTRGRLISEAGYQARLGEWLITDADRAYVKSLMHGRLRAGQGGQLDRPAGKGINGMPVDYEYVKPARRLNRCDARGISNGHGKHASVIESLQRQQANSLVQFLNTRNTTLTFGRTSAICTCSSTSTPPRPWRRWTSTPSAR